MKKELKYPKFSERHIQEHLVSNKFLIRGKNYYQNGRVNNLTCNSDMTVFESDVDGSYGNCYHCILYVDKGKLQDYECECEAYTNIPGACKHIVATMFAITACRKKAEEIAQEKKELKKEKLEQESINSKSNQSCTLNEAEDKIDKKDEISDLSSTKYTLHVDEYSGYNQDLIDKTLNKNNFNSEKESKKTPTEENSTDLKRILSIVACVVIAIIILIVVPGAGFLFLVVLMVLIGLAFFLG